MGFSTNYENIGSGNELLPVGNYEVIVKSAAPNVTKNGAPYLDIRMVIRNDIAEQHYQNKYIFHSIYKKRNPSPLDMQVDGYSFKQLMGLAKAAKLPAGKDYATVEDLCRDFVNKCVNVEIEHQEDNTGKLRERVKFCNETKYPDCKHVFKEPAKPVTSNTYQAPKQDAFAQPATASSVGKLDDFEEIISSDDLPF